MARPSGGRHTRFPPPRPRAPASTRGYRLPISSRLLTGLGLAAALAGVAIAIGVGAVPTPLTANATKAPRLSAAPGVQATLSSPGRVFTTALSGPPADRSPASASPPASQRPTARPVPTPSVAPSGSRPSPSPRPSPAPRPSPSPELVPAPTAEYQTPKGRNELAWSQAILRAFGAPLTSANIVSMGYWMQNEAGKPPYGIVGANNPINVSQPGYGGTPIQNEGGGYYLYSYPTVKDGIDAIVAYLHRPNYAGIVAALKAGIGLSSPSLAAEIMVYSGNHYSAIPDAWGASQGRPET
jgi:hypothetical protein